MFPNIADFIKTYVTRRNKSFFSSDLINNAKTLTTEIEGKSILVIGGAGTIGSSFIKAALKYQPGKLVVVDTNENGLTELTRTLRSDSSIAVPKSYLTYPMSFSSEVFYKMLERQGAFDIVANFAAHKHVRSEKDSYSIEAMIRNNVLDAKRLLDYLKTHKPKHFFCVSTDKAANPVNVMGASKKLMEHLIMSYSDEIKITTARFANVAFSNGSLLFGHVERIFQRQPISCPSDVRRFFVSPEESGEICLLTCILGDSGDIYFPKLDDEDMINFRAITEDFFNYLEKSICICNSEQEAKEMAKNMSANSSYPVYFFETNTSGEKLYEEFHTEVDEVNMSRYDSIGVITNSLKPSFEDMEETMRQIESVFSKADCTKEEVVAAMSVILPDFHHVETGKSLDQKM